MYIPMQRPVIIVDSHPRVLDIVPRFAHTKAHQDRKDMRLIDGDPVLDTIPKSFKERVREECKLGAYPLVEPASVFLLGFQWRVPVEDRDPRRNVLGDERVDKAIVVCESGLVDCPIAFDDPSPRDRETVSVDAILCHQVDVVLRLVV